MIRWLAILLPLVLALALLFGWTFPNRPEEPLGVARGGVGVRGLVLRPGESTGDAVRFLRTLRSDPPPPYVAPPPPPSPPPPPPPPPDVADVFSRSLSAVRRDPATGVYSILVRPAAGGPQTVSMAEGDVFWDGWRVGEISEYGVTLSKGRETRRVRLYP